MKLRSNYFLALMSKNQGEKILSFSILGKIIGFLSTSVLVRILSVQDFGRVQYVLAFVTLVTPFSGFGSNLSLLRYGSIATSFSARKKLYLAALKYGTLSTIPLIIAFTFGIGFIVKSTISGTATIVAIISTLLLTNLLFNTQQSYIRLLRLNSLFASNQLFLSSTLMILNIGLAYFYDGIGYSIGLVLSPLVVFIFAEKYILSSISKNVFKIKRSVVPDGFWRYGLFVGIGAIVGQITYNMDLLMIGGILNDETKVGIYKVGALITSQLMILPGIVQNTLFVEIAQMFDNRTKIINYLKSYIKFTLPFVLILSTILYIFSSQIIEIIFGDSYHHSAQILRVHAIGLVIAFLTFKPIGGLLMAFGKSSWNVYNAIFTASLNLLLNYILISKLDIYGAAIATLISFAIGGIFSCILIIIYVRRFAK